MTALPTTLITGASSGIGATYAERFARRGHDLVLVARDNARLETLAARLRQETGVAIEVMRADLTRHDELANVEMRLREDAAIGILINNAGVSWGAPLDEFPEVGWDKVFDTNVKGVFFLTQKLLPLLEARATNDDPSRVVNIGSIDGIRTPIFDTHSYGPSKAALHSLTRQMGSKLVKRNIIMNAIAPGPFPTWMLSTGVGTGGDVDNTDWSVVARGNPRKRVGTPEDIAGLAIFLCSRAGAYTVGEVIACDGGQVNS